MERFGIGYNGWLIAFPTRREQYFRGARFTKPLSGLTAVGIGYIAQYIPILDI